MVRGEERHRAMTWMQRLKRVFNVDIEVREHCGGHVKVIASIEGPEVIEQILRHLKQKALRQIPKTASCRQSGHHLWFSVCSTHRRLVYLIDVPKFLSHTLSAFAACRWGNCRLEIHSPATFRSNRPKYDLPWAL